MANVKTYEGWKGDKAHRLPVRWIMPTADVSCTRCGEEWQEGDPALLFGCHDCGTAAGWPCVRRAGGNEHVCASRDLEAERAGRLSVCPSLSWTNRHSKPQPFACTLQPPIGSMPIRTASPPCRALS
jgi:predicted RNA-binding Zn-ribbon protein involved in translation (DUF1610 family)